MKTQRNCSFPVFFRFVLGAVLAVLLWSLMLNAFDPFSHRKEASLGAYWKPTVQHHSYQFETVLDLHRRALRS